VLALDSPELKSNSIDQACADRAACCRPVAGALLADLSLAENLRLESACTDRPPPAWLEDELEALFDAAGCAGALPAWHLLPAGALPLDRLRTLVGRALAADPDWLLVDAEAWDDGLLAPERFAAAFLHRYPWRGLAWLCATPGRAEALRARLAEFAP
jgi:hypothetical protein